jgi:hypothetical protein
MSYTLIKTAAIISEQTKYDAEYLDNDKDFKRLSELIPANAIKDLKTAWVGDIKELERGKKGDSLFQLLMKAEMLKKKYQINISSEISKILNNLGNLAHHLFANPSEFRGAAKNGSTLDDKWGYHYARRESIEEIEQDMLYEQLKRELTV